MKYTTDGKFEVFAGDRVIARSYIGSGDSYEVRILQGMPRMETWRKIFEDCPQFAKENGMKIDTTPRLFGA